MLAESPAISGKQSFAGPVLVTGISVMLLIISHSLSNVFASKRWICYSWQNFLRPVHFYLVLLVPSRGLILISTKLKKKCFIIFQKFPLETVCVLTALRVLLSLNLCLHTRAD